VRKVRESQLAGLVVIERGHDEQRRLTPDEALEIVMANCADSYGFPPYDAIEDFLQRMNGITHLLDEERGIVATALTGLPATLVGSSTMEWWRELPRIADTDPAQAPPAAGASPVPVAITE
jgi:hypothetical protein